MNVERASADCASEHCITCGDVAVAMTVLDLDAARGLALCAGREGEHHTVQTALVEPLCCGDRILVHAGTAIAMAAVEAGS